MEKLIPIIAIGGFWAFLIIWVWLSHATKMRKLGAAPVNPFGGSADAASSPELLNELRRMEERVRTLERILDADHPGWRSRL